MKSGRPVAKTGVKTAVVYLRVSTKEQAEKGGRAEGFSIPAQREALNRKALSMDAVIVEEFIDAGESAKSADRPDLQRMLRYLAENPVDYVLVHKVDRLARNRIDDVEITLAIRKSGATLVSATENIDETPSGTLLHGIMSSIAEFYSRNLATEVDKGMSQKVKTGGTPGKAPLGYNNIGRLTPEGREERTVEVDAKRAELISWAFIAFATGEWTLRSLANELETRGLTTRRTPKQPSRALRPNVLHNMLTNPYYKGDVVYRGVTHRGKHQPLTDPVTWQNVQDVLAVHAVGEKQREHSHYLKSSVFCGECESRLIITNTKNRHGTIYPYFICLGRHQKRTTCTRKAILVARVEELVDEYWATIQLDPITRNAMEECIRTGLSAMRGEAEAEHKQLITTRASLTAQREKLIEAVYSGAIPMDRIASEQQRITTQLAKLDGRLTATAERFDHIETHLSRVLDLIRDGYVDYLAANPFNRRLLNQALFTHLYIDEDSTRAEYAKPFDILLHPRTRAAARAITDNREAGLITMTDLLSGPMIGSDQKIPRALDTAGDFTGNPSTAILGVEGLKMTTLAALRDSLSNLSPPLLKALDLCARQRTTSKKRHTYDTSKELIAQTGSSDPSAVRLHATPNRRLSPATVDRLVRTYDAGHISQLELARRFGVHVETVNRHIRRRKQARRLGCAVIDSYRITDRYPVTKRRNRIASTYFNLIDVEFNAKEAT